MQRWISADPLAIHGLGADPNLYAYVSGRSLQAVDPLGLDLADALTRYGGFSKEAAQLTAGVIHVVNPATAIADRSSRGTTETVSAATNGDYVGAAASAAETFGDLSGIGSGTVSGVVNEGIETFQAASAATQLLVGKGKNADVHLKTIQNFALTKSSTAVVAATAGMGAGAMRRSNSGPAPFLKQEMAKVLERASPAWLDGYMAEMDVGCFVAGTPVWTAHGRRPIETVVVGDWVLSRSDRGDGGLTWRQVLQTLPKPPSKVLTLELKDTNGATDRLGVTANHPFWTEGGGWIAAGRLQPGDRVWSLERGWLRVISTQLQPELQRVYNFEVDEDHTYAVGALAVWVHNTCPTGARTWQEAGISTGDATRIQNAATRTKQKITVVGSRAKGAAHALSDWDYVMSGNSKQRHSARSSVPRGRAGGELDSAGRETGIDVYTGSVRANEPHVVFEPKK